MKIDNKYMKIEVYNNYNIANISFDYMKIIHDMESYSGFKDYKEVSLILVDLEEITNINREYRKKDYPTDVISFEAEIDDFDMDDINDYAGDVFLCIDKVYEQSKLYGHSNEREFAFLLCHGILHLHGYDHIKEEDEKEMFLMQDKVLNDLDYRKAR